MKILFLFLSGLFGLCVGSFLNCVIYRLEKEEKLGGRSYCPNCKHILRWQDLIPVFSFMFLRGKCRHCSKKISFQYPLVEILTALMFLLIADFSRQGGIPLWRDNQFSIIQFSNLIHSLFLFYIASALIVIFVYDLRHYLIPDKVLFPAIVISLIYRFFESVRIENFNIKNFIGGHLERFSVNSEKFFIEYSFSFANFIIAALLASGFFLIIFLISRGKWIGFGDVKLAVLLGLILGFPAILLGLFISFLLGSIVGLWLMLAGKKGLKSEVPFAPFLIAGTFVTLFWGNTAMNWYAFLFGFKPL